MADSLSDADKIRNKRLAKLGNPAPGQPDSEESSKSQTPSNDTSRPTASPPPAEQKKPQITITKSSESTSNSNPFSQLGMQQPAEKKPKINITPQRNAFPQKRGADGKVISQADEPIEQWEDRQLSNIFRATLTRGNKDLHGHALYFLEGTKAELEESDQPLKLSTGLLDQALLEAASNVEKKTTPLDYLLECWKRVSRQYRTLRKNGEEDPKFRIVKEARRLCMSYCIFAATMPEMFGLESADSSPLAPHFLLDSEDDHGIDHDFMMEAIARFPDDESVKDVLVGAMEFLSQQLGGMTMNDNFKPYVNALRFFVQYPPLINGIVQSPRFLPSTITAPTLERATILGPFFALSPLQADVNRSYFSAPSTRDKAYIVNSQRALRMTLGSHQLDLLDIVNRIIKTGKEPRERMLDWFARCCNLNHKRRALQVDEKAVSSDGMMVNITICLDQLCEPFMDSSFTKIDRIEIDYLRRRSRVDISDETKINADQNAADEFYKDTAEGTNNFISEVFFLALAAHHYGTEAANTNLVQLDKELKRMKKHLDEMDSDRQRLLNDPVRLAQFDNAVKKWKDYHEKGTCRKLALEGVLMDEQSQGRSIQFGRYVMVWLLRLVTPSHDYPKKPLKLPLPDEAPQAFKCLPEYYLEDVVTNFKFITRHMPWIVNSTQSEELVTLCITFLRNSDYVKNPYVKGGLITIMFTGVWPTPNHTKGILGDLLCGLPFANEHLLHALIKFYIEIEVTGAHTQFFDKFNIRYEIFQIIKCIWSNTLYRENLEKEASQNLQFFIRFVNLLLNDVTWVLDESISGLEKIHNWTLELEQDGAAMEAEQKKQKEEALAEMKGRTKSYMGLMNETVAMLKMFTEALATAFTKAEIVQRLADMLDYNLEALVGPKSRNLKVQNMEEYGFNPRMLLSEIVDIFLNLGVKAEFVDAVAKDERCYKQSNIDQATKILKSKGLKSPAEIVNWVSLGERFAKARELLQQEEEDYGDYPEEYTDPLMATLMSDPVILPGSRTTIDRATIQTYLLSAPHDPFSRAPLKIEDVIPDDELREKINAFKAEKKAKRSEQQANVMDTAPG